MKNFYFISEFNDKGNNAGSKARNDLEKVFSEKKWIKINNSAITASAYKRNWIYFVKSFFDAAQLFTKIMFYKNVIIFCQYPALKGSILYRALSVASKKNNICYVIHDINALRAKKDQKKYLLDKELAILNKASAVVVHNERMRDILIENGLKTNIVIELGLFDYLAKSSKLVSRKLTKNIVYAGNLVKGSFIDQISDSTLLDSQLYLYGPNFNKDYINTTKVKYMGSFPPNDVVDKLEGSFGLVWDGPTVDTCGGSYGEYTRYNNPHKLSLYIGAGLPVIVWSQAAISKFVIDNKIGFTIDRLSEIPIILNEVDGKTYQEYLVNINKLREKVRSGFYTKEAINKVINSITLGDN